MHALNRRAVFAITAFAFIFVAMAALACAGPQAEPTVAPVATTGPAATTPPATATAPPAPVPAATATSAPTATTAPEPAAAGAMVATEAPTAAPADKPEVIAGAIAVFRLGEGTVARYKVEEVLANTGFKVATGETTDVAGNIAFDADGNVVAEDSRIAVQAATLRTDSNRRDGYVRNRTLLTDAYPEVVFRPTAIPGLKETLASGASSTSFTITGDLTVRDQTREVTWDATAEFKADGSATGSASVEFTFDDFGMDKPSVAIVLSVEDTIRLELDFTGTMTPK